MEPITFHFNCNGCLTYVVVEFLRFELQFCVDGKYVSVLI